MKITAQTPELSTTLNPSSTAAAQKAAQQPAAAAATAANAGAAQSVRSAGVAVTVSTMAQSLEKTAASSADIDTQKVAKVRSAIQDGTYTVNPEAIADKLLSNAQEMLKRTRA